MKDEDIREKIAKLPVWAREYIKTLEMRREAALGTLNRHVDQETPSAFYYEEWPCTGEEAGPTIKRFYIQAHSITCDFDGIELDISAHHFNNQRGIRLQWNNPDRGLEEIAFIPESFQTARLIARKDMR